jgi:thymidylate synthase (FAD)
MELVNKVSVDLIQTNATDDMVAMAAWVSHDQDSEERLANREQVKKLINFLYTNKHMSPFEHGQFTFKIDVPLFVAREFHRHRTFSYNEVSGRYTEMQPRFWVGDEARIQKGKPGDYYFEPGDEEQTELYHTSKKKAVKRAWKQYKKRLASGMAKEQAREDLPLSLMTQFYATVNPRNLMAFLTLRNEKHALKEIQAVAVQMEEIFAEQMPLTYEAYRRARAAEVFDKSDAEGLRLAKEQILRQKQKIAEQDELLNAYADDLRDLNTQNHDLLAQVDILKAQKEEVGRKSANEAAHWYQMYEEKRDELYEALEENRSLKLKLKELESAVTKPKQDVIYHINSIVKDVDPAKIAEQVKRVIDLQEKRTGRRR